MSVLGYVLDSWLLGPLLNVTFSSEQVSDFHIYLWSLLPTMHIKCTNLMLAVCCVNYSVGISFLYCWLNWLFDSIVAPTGHPSPQTFSAREFLIPNAKRHKMTAKHFYSFALIFGTDSTKIIAQLSTVTVLLSSEESMVLTVLLYTLSVNFF